MAPRTTTNQQSEWPAVVVAIGILLLLGAILVTAAARWSAAELQDVAGVLAPVLGVVTGAFVTYFFTRHTAAAAGTVAQNAMGAAQKAADAAQTATDVVQRTNDIAQRAADAAVTTREVNELRYTSQAEQTTSQLERARALHNALTVAFGLVDEKTARKLRDDPTISAVLRRW